MLEIVLELAILGLLKEQQLHGYELKKRVAETLGGRSGVSYGSLYPALGRLEADGAVAVVEAAGGGRGVPLTGSLGGELAVFRARRAVVRGTRGKKVYRLTERGEALFTELLAAENATAEDERLFNLRLSFARHLPPGARIGLLERRRAHLLERLGRLSARVRTSRDRLDDYARSLLDHDQETTEHDLSWIDRLLATERAGAATPLPVPEVLTPAPPLSAAEARRTEVPGSGATPDLPAVPPAPIPAAPAATTIAGTYRPSLSGIRPRPSEESITL